MFYVVCVLLYCLKLEWCFTLSDGCLHHLLSLLNEGEGGLKNKIVKEH